MTSLLDPQRVLERAAERLTARFDGIVAAETVERVVFESYASLMRTARITDHVPALAEKFAKDRLTALATSKGLVAKPHPEVLFLCVGNSGRSQMAAAMMRLIAGERIVVRSAGSQPGEEILPHVQEALSEIGADVSHEFPKPLTDDVVRASDVVITMGCGDACPVYPGKRYEDWPIADPAELDLGGVRDVRAELRHRVERLAAELAPA
ncbi:low molecular weight phosphatase family protein [Pseudoclavibacter endophyticus]|uniref:Arsenate reductase ArsC n=1 Tax=Pseudoclavibacter endophyticus TaxID=1778590 RepID=A0A6H9WU04_9MICO|nr:arsenate reductase ArsC [Pseudoclavibacter endophyticus]KAB1650347.1 arsenate reductase ArsC [Pseudoclavibacter endophyticus]GGA54918.1 low molecular weight phosphatase family protein [Pseudoclavibacter endophyticus]